MSSQSEGYLDSFAKGGGNRNTDRFKVVAVMGTAVIEDGFRSNMGSRGRVVGSVAHDHRCGSLDVDVIQMGDK